MMNRKKAYIAGKVTGENLISREKKFRERSEILKKQGWEVVNPLEIVPATADWKTAMKICINALLDCDAYYMLPDWRNSRGAKIELQLAIAFGLKNLNGKL